MKKLMFGLLVASVCTVSANQAWALTLIEVRLLATQVYRAVIEGGIAQVGENAEVDEHMNIKCRKMEFPTAIDEVEPFCAPDLSEYSDAGDVTSRNLKDSTPGIALVGYKPAVTTSGKISNGIVKVQSPGYRGVTCYVQKVGGFYVAPPSCRR